jgi:prolyl-tRNA synthetase
MLSSKLFIPTFRENPAEAEVVSHRLLLRAGYVRQLAAGIYSYLCLARRSLLKSRQMVREEMDAMGAQEMQLPALNPAELWQVSGRWDLMGDNMFRLKDRFGRDLCLGITQEEVMTSIRKTIAEVSRFTRLPHASRMKSLVMVAHGKPVLALLRGDHQLSETKFASVTGALEVRAAFPAEIVDWFGADQGPLGPVGVTGMAIVADLALESRRKMIAGANKNGYHLRNVTPGRDFQPQYADLRQVSDGDPCAVCGAPLKLHKTIEAGHIFKLGYTYAEPMPVVPVPLTSENFPRSMARGRVADFKRLFPSATRVIQATEGFSIA